MILKQLNGEYLDVPEIPYPPVLYDHYTYLKKIIHTSTLRRRVADALKIHPNWIRFVPRERDQKGAQNPGYDAYVIVTDRPFIDLSRTAIYAGKAGKVGKVGKEEKSGGKAGKAGKGGKEEKSGKEYFFYDNVGDPDDENVTRLLSNVMQFAYLSGFCTNPNDRVVDWLLANPQHITYPDFLGNSNERAVDLNIQWLDRHYADLLPRFDTSPELTELYEKYLTFNRNPRMFVYVFENCPYHNTNNIDRLGDRVEKVWAWRRGLGWL